MRQSLLTIVAVLILGFAVGFMACAQAAKDYTRVLGSPDTGLYIEHKGVVYELVEVE